MISSRLTELRKPPPPDSTEQLSPKLSLTGINIVASALARAERVAVVYLGKDIPP